MARAVSQHRPTDSHETPRLRVIQGHGGGPPPQTWEPPVSNAQLAILIVIAFEAMVFVGLITTYFVLRSSNHLAWPPPDMPRLPLAVSSVNTVMLTLSAFTMWRARSAIRAADEAGLRSSLTATTVLGVGFLAVQGSEWSRLIRQGLTLSSGSYGSIFYTLVGLHALHVVAAVVWLLAILVLARRGHFTAKRHAGVQLCAMYWYFVCALWLVVFGLVYVYE
jgi:heme/copper-type cytochrome/quinol oxidase subunit 3